MLRVKVMHVEASMDRLKISGKDRLFEAAKSNTFFVALN